MLLLRIEDAEERGCYTFSDARQNATRAHDFGNCILNTTEHPDPWEDPLLESSWGRIVDGEHIFISSVFVRFAFASPQQYHAWFHTQRSREILREIGFHASILDVPDDWAAVGGSQAVFDKRRATRVGKMPCTAPLEELRDAYCR